MSRWKLTSEEANCIEAGIGALWRIDRYDASFLRVGAIPTPVADTIEEFKSLGYSSYRVDYVHSPTKEMSVFTLAYWGPGAHGAFINGAILPLMKATRVDVRFIASEEGDVLGLVREALDASTNPPLSVGSFNSRVQTQKLNRPTGRGSFIGSHKSDRRVVVYQRREERAAIEINLSGDWLKRRLSSLHDEYTKCSRADAAVSIALEAAHVLVHYLGKFGLRPAFIVVSARSSLVKR